jgi:hypothetical protein
MIRKAFLLPIFFSFITIEIIGQNVASTSTVLPKAYLTGQFTMGLGYYLNGGDLFSPGFEFKWGRFLSPRFSWGGGIAYTQFKPLDGFYGISLLSEWRYFIRDENRRWRFSGVADLGVGMGGSRLLTGWGTYRPGPRMYAGASMYKKIESNMTLTFEVGYLYQYLTYKDNTPGRGWQIFQTESILKYHFRRIQVKAGLFF